MQYFRCAFCGLATGWERTCGRCKAILPWVLHACACCAEPLTLPLSPGVCCAGCQQRPPRFDRARAPLRYAFPVDRGLKRLKYRRQTIFAAAFAELLLPCIGEDFSACDALVPVPLHRWRHVRRGFNQADEIARLLSRGTGLPIMQSVVRTRATKSQSGLSAAARRRNLRGAFAVRGNVGCRFPLIVDDVMTTGATSNQLAAVLLDAGCEAVGVLAVARSGSQDHLAGQPPGAGPVVKV